jgi:hypothetical protein
VRLVIALAIVAWLLWMLVRYWLPPGGGIPTPPT